MVFSKYIFCFLPVTQCQYQLYSDSSNNSINISISFSISSYLFWRALEAPSPHELEVLETVERWVPFPLAQRGNDVMGLEFEFELEQGWY